MKKELDNMIKKNKILVLENERQEQEISRLEEEIKETINIYTKIIE